MNNSETNIGGWGACVLRGTLNSTTYDSLENKEYIKEVNKQYIATYNVASSVTTSTDKLWLLSCSEIWNNGRNGKPYGHAIAKEGEQYKYYETINAVCTSPCSSLAKGGYWWLRSAGWANAGYPNYFNSIARKRCLGCDWWFSK